MKRLVSFGEGPARLGLEWDEFFDLERHPEKASYYAELIRQRTHRRKVKKNGNLH